MSAAGTADPEAPQEGSATPGPTDTTPSTTSVSPDAAALWRAARGPLLLAVLILLVVSGTVLLTGGRDHGELDPRAVDHAGSRALAELLRGQGVDVTLVTDTADLTPAIERAPETTTLLVPFPNRLTAEQRVAVGVLRPGRVVLVGADQEALDTFEISAHDFGDAGTADVQPRCDLPEALRAGDADLGGHGYAANTSGTVRCYPRHGAPSLVIVPRDGGDVVLLGSGAALRNDRLADRGNASLSLQLLGAEPHLLWYLPEGADTGEHKGLLSLLPDGWRFGMLQLGFALVLFALYRARRLGPVVNEPLPVVVRATETAEGRARLYRRGGTVGRAAEELRAATRGRIAARLGLGDATLPPAVLTDAVAARTGRSTAEAHELLYGANPDDEAALVALADRLDLLEENVKTGVRQP
ncbi:DUF4350 domain-containing protein [Yinghuangia seranimata]|uniref:DUF4350 domain-containing protein n=1 Tax=Yinghuangia seranimata TaxID=408067 RepID=UPI00248C0218|nr:DUF4350 domain-containing protein [Yinghuangia seranimata]MDI2131446.1 DUF4350 domain-containing protein [Yinghuangia seranimata]